MANNHLSIAQRLDLRLKGLPVPDLVEKKSNSFSSPRWNGYIPQPKIFEDDRALEIRRLYATGNYYQRELAAKYKVSKATIQHVIWGKGAYRHLNKTTNFATDW